MRSSRNWLNFLDKVGNDRYKSAEHIASKFQELLQSAVDLNDPTRLQLISTYCRKFSLARKKCSERTCLAYAQSLLETDGDFSISEILQITKTASECHEAMRAEKTLLTPPPFELGF